MLIILELFEEKREIHIKIPCLTCDVCHSFWKWMVNHGYAFQIISRCSHSLLHCTAKSTDSLSLSLIPCVSSFLAPSCVGSFGATRWQRSLWPVTHTLCAYVRVQLIRSRSVSFHFPSPRALRFNVTVISYPSMVDSIKRSLQVALKLQK